MTARFLFTPALRLRVDEHRILSKPVAKTRKRLLDGQQRAHDAAADRTGMDAVRVRQERGARCPPHAYLPTRTDCDFAIEPRLVVWLKIKPRFRAARSRIGALSPESRFQALHERVRKY